MNNVSITGHLARNAILNGTAEKRAMKFTIAAPSGFDTKKNKQSSPVTPAIMKAVCLMLITTPLKNG